MNRFFIAAMMALLTMPMFAQDVIEPDFPVIEPPTIFVPPSRLKDLKPVELTGYETSVRVTGFVCQTEITMTFYNPNRIQLAGDLVFPLPEGVTVSGYALDIEGEMVDAVAVTKEKARVTLEKEMRRGADPGGAHTQQDRGGHRRVAVFHHRRDPDLVLAGTGQLQHRSHSGRAERGRRDRGRHPHAHPGRGRR